RPLDGDFLNGAWLVSELITPLADPTSLAEFLDLSEQVAVARAEDSRRTRVSLLDFGVPAELIELSARHLRIGVELGLGERVLAAELFAHVDADLTSTQVTWA